MEESYSHRRALAHDTLGRGPMPLALSHGVSFGPNGMIAFGSRNVRIVKLAELDEASSTGPTLHATTARVERALRVRASGAAQNAADETNAETLPPPAKLEAAACEYKEAAAAAPGAADAQAARREQHLWKLVGAALAQSIDEQVIAVL